VNVVGQLAVTQALLPALRAARGRVVIVGSIAGRSALPFLGAWRASAPSRRRARGRRRRPSASHGPSSTR
jgi:NADP-dependent 3-hydroxy acid dehydrogenase YdfG